MNPMRMDGRRRSIWRRPAAALIAAALYFGPVPAALAGRELVYVFNTGSKDVTVIDPVSHTVVRTHPLGVSVRWLSDEQNYWDGRRIWTYTIEAGISHAVVIDPRGFRVIKKFLWAGGLRTAPFWSGEAALPWSMWRAKIISR